MARKRPSARKVFTATSLPPDLHEQLRWLAADTGITLAGLLRWGAILVLLDIGEELPESVAHLRRVPFAGEQRKSRHQSGPERLTLCFSDVEFATLERLVEHTYLGYTRMQPLVEGLVLKALPPDPSTN